jgi:hypothetical protein
MDVADEDLVLLARAGDVDAFVHSPEPEVTGNSGSRGGSCVTSTWPRTPCSKRS